MESRSHTLTLAASLILTVLLGACGLQKSDSGELAAKKQGGPRSVNEAVLAIKAFGAPLGCQGCHTGSGPLAWMSADADESRAHLTRLIDTANPGGSFFVAKATTNHFGGSATLLDARSWMPSIQDFVRTLAEEAKGSPSPTPGPGGPTPTPTPPTGSVANWKASGEVALPATLPVYPAFSTITIQLSTINAALQGVSLEVRVSSEPTIPNGMALWNTRISSTRTGAVVIDGLVFQLNQMDHAYEGKTLRLRSGVVQNPGALFAGDKVLMTRKPTMTVRVLFNMIEFRNSVPCKNLTGFVNNVLPMLTQARLLNLANVAVGNTCVGCHGANAPGGFNVAAAVANEVKCIAVLSRSNLGSPELSPVMQRPRIAPHPVLLQFSAIDQQAFVDWVISER